MENQPRQGVRGLKPKGITVRRPGREREDSEAAGKPGRKNAKKSEKVKDKLQKIQKNF